MAWFIKRTFRDKKGCVALFSATQSVARRRYLTDMLTLETLKTEVDDLRETVRMADSDSVETRQLLKAQTSTLNALRADQIGLRGLMDQQAKILGEQSIGIGNLVIAMNQTQQEVHALRSDVHGLKTDVKDLKTDVTDLKRDVTRMDKNIGAIMRHLGVDPDES